MIIKPEKVNNFWNNSYIEYESNGHRNKNLSLKLVMHSRATM